MQNLGDGDPIVFVHGRPLSHRMFESQYHHLVDGRFRCIGVDLRGFGESDKPDGEYGYDVFADDLKAVFETMDLDDVTLVGFSMGGGVVTQYMGRHDEAHVAGLALLGAASPCLIERPDFPQELPVGSLDELVQDVRLDRPGLNAQLASCCFIKSKAKN